MLSVPAAALDVQRASVEQDQLADMGNSLRAGGTAGDLLIDDPLAVRSGGGGPSGIGSSSGDLLLSGGSDSGSSSGGTNLQPQSSLVRVAAEEDMPVLCCTVAARCCPLSIPVWCCM